MPSDSSFKRLGDVDAASVTLRVDGETVSAHLGETVAAALVAAGRLAFRETAVSGRKRGPFCMMGACFDCLVEIDARAQSTSLHDVGRGRHDGALHGRRACLGQGRCQWLSASRSRSSAPARLAWRRRRSWARRAAGSPFSTSSQDQEDRSIAALRRSTTAESASSAPTTEPAKPCFRPSTMRASIISLAPPSGR